MKHNLIILLIFIFSKLISFSQGTGIAVGYNYGSYVVPMHNIEILAFEFNRNHPNYSKHHKIGSTYRGLTFLFCKSTSDNGGVEVSYSQKLIKSHAEGVDYTGDTAYHSQLKIGLGSLSFGYFAWIGDFAKVGVNWDMASICRFTKRVGPEDSYKDSLWTGVFSKKGFYDTGFTLYCEVSLGHIIKIRPYYQWSLISPITTSYKLSNFGVAMFIGYESKD